MKSKLISISAVSAGFIAIFLLIGAYFEFADVFTIVISSVFTILPLYYKSYKASLLTYLAGGVIAFLCSGFNLLSLVFPAYFAFFGIYPVVKFFLQEKGHKYVGFIIGIIWCVLAFIGLYYYYTFVMFGSSEGIPKWIIDYAEIFVIILGIIFFVVFDRFLIVVKRFSDYYLKKIIK